MVGLYLSAHYFALFRKAVALAMVQISEAAGQCLAQARDVVIGVDVGSALLEPRTVCFERLFPTLFRHCLC